MRRNRLAFDAILVSIVVLLVSVGIYTKDRTPAPTPIQEPIATTTTLGVALPSGTAVFETSLQDRIAAADTSMTLVNASTTSGEDVSGYNCFTIDEGRSDAEFVCGTVSAKTVSSLERGLSLTTGTTTVTASKEPHRKGASVKITDYPLIQRMRHQLSGTDTIAALMTYTSGVACTAASASTTLCGKAYADALANQGAATSSESVAGIAMLATALRAASSTDLGADTPLVLQAKNATDTPQYGCAAGYTSTAGAGCSVVALLTGKIKQTWLNLTEAFTWSGLNTFSGGLTSTGTTTISASSLTTNPFVLNGVAYKFPTTQGASSSVPATDGAGNITFNTVDSLLTKSSVVGATTTSLTHANSSAETTYDSAGTITLAAGKMGTGGTLRIRLYISDWDWVASATASNVLTVRFKLGGTTVCTLTSSDLATADDGLRGYFECEVLNTSASTQVTFAASVATDQIAGTNAATRFITAVNTATINTATSQQITATLQWTAANVGNTITLSGLSATVF